MDEYHKLQWGTSELRSANIERFGHFQVTTLQSSNKRITTSIRSLLKNISTIELQVTLMFGKDCGKP